ncbi:MAG: DUF903 domain-containing protein [Desulfovibrionales bacterium]
MKLHLWIILAVFLALTACQSHHHFFVTTSTGRDYVSRHPPELQHGSQTYVFEDLDGVRIFLAREEVLSIQPFERSANHDMNESVFFVPPEHFTPSKDAYPNEQ